MPKYTREDIIVWEDDSRAQEAIGKECYFSNYAALVLNNSNNDKGCRELLIKIDEGIEKPFVSNTGEHWTYMIVKKEDSKPELVPFESPEEFIEAWFSTTVPSFRPVENVGSSIDGSCIWLKYHTDIDDEYSFRAVTEIWNDGVVLGSDNDTTKWSELLEVCQFVDGTPCGKLKE